MSVWTLGINHHTAPLDLRGRFSVAADQIAPKLHGLRQLLSNSRGVKTSEATILSTCNRTEIYCSAPTDAQQATVEWMARIGGVSVDELQKHTYYLEQQEAARHAFRVACGLDSMVLGEAQILGQMKTAVREADKAGMLGSSLNQLFQRSFAVAKQVRSSTEIGTHSISMAAAVVRLAGQLFEDLTQLKVLFVGAGEMVDLVATHFSAHKPLSITIANRTLERGEKLATRLGAKTLRIAEVLDNLHQFDVVISCTASSVPIIGLGAVERALKLRRNKPLFMVDLAVPRDIEPEVSRRDSVYLYTVDDLAKVVQAGKNNRQAAVAQAEAIIEGGVQSFVRWLEMRKAENPVVPLIRQINSQAELWENIEIARARKMLASGENIDNVLQALASGLSKKFLHGAMTELRNETEQEKTAQTVSRIFLRGEMNFPCQTKH